MQERDVGFRQIVCEGQQAVEVVMNARPPRAPSQGLQFCHKALARLVLHPAGLPLACPDFEPLEKRLQCGQIEGSHERVVRQ